MSALLASVATGGCAANHADSAPADDSPSTATEPTAASTSLLASDPTSGEPAPAGSSGVAEIGNSSDLSDEALAVVTLPPTIAVVGDSLTVAATQQITDVLEQAGARTVVVDAREGRRMVSGSEQLPGGVEAIETILATATPDAWVIALGTNDVGAQAVPDRYLADLRTTLAAIPESAPIVWVDVWIRDWADDTVEANELLRSELTRRTAPTGVVDWYQAAQADGMIVGDGVHLTDTGEAEFARLIGVAARHVAATGAADPPPATAPQTTTPSTIATSTIATPSATP